MNVNATDADSIIALARWAEPWRREFSRSVFISTGVLFGHVAFLVCAGGLSFATDRACLFPLRSGDGDLQRGARERVANRRLAIGALAGVAASGMLLFLADVDAFLHLSTFWLKMGLIALLTTNALSAQRHDERLCSAPFLATRRNGWRISRCRAHAIVSLALWLMTLLAGTALLAG